MKRGNNYEFPYSIKRSGNENMPSGSAQYQMGRNNETIHLMPIQHTWNRNNYNQRVSNNNIITNAQKGKVVNDSLGMTNQNVANAYTNQMNQSTSHNPVLNQSYDRMSRPGTSKSTQQHTIVELGNDNDNAFEKKMRALSMQKFLTGSVCKIIRWHKLLDGLFCLYEVIGPLHSLQEGAIPLQKVLLMRDIQGPVLKVIHYCSDRIELNNFYLGQIIRCVGRIISDTTLQSVCIREATAGEISALSRLTYLSDLSVKTYVQNKC